MSSDFESKLPLAFVALDRDYLTREDPGALDLDNLDVILLSNSRILFTSGLEFAVQKPESTLVLNKLIYLGKDFDSGRALALSLVAETRLETEGSWFALREISHKVSAKTASIFSQSLALANWHENHKFCPKCGRETRSKKFGWVLECENGHELFPRTDPAVIVAVVDEQDRLLLGSQRTWEANRFSILAGFVEPGESLQAAAAREVFEESGIVVEELQFRGSQAWPFPYSLMFGFMAKKIGGVLAPDEVEIETLRWFTREELAAEAKDLLLPGKISIARALIEEWFGGELISSGELQ